MCYLIFDGKSMKIHENDPTKNSQGTSALHHCRCFRVSEPRCRFASPRLAWGATATGNHRKPPETTGNSKQNHGPLGWTPT